MTQSRVAPGHTAKRVGSSFDQQKARGAAGRPTHKAASAAPSAKRAWIFTAGDRAATSLQRLDCTQQPAFGLGLEGGGEEEERGGTGDNRSRRTPGGRPRHAR